MSILLLSIVGIGFVGAALCADGIAHEVRKSKIDQAAHARAITYFDQESEGDRETDQPDRNGDHRLSPAA